MVDTAGRLIGLVLLICNMSRPDLMFFCRIGRDMLPEPVVMRRERVSSIDKSGHEYDLSLMVIPGFLVLWRFCTCYFIEIRYNVSL